jgi:hypothetical protein
MAVDVRPSRTATETSPPSACSPLPARITSKLMISEMHLGLDETEQRGRPHHGAPVLMSTSVSLNTTMPDNTEQQRKATADAVVPIELDLLEQRSFRQRVMMHRYAVRDAKEASSC